VRRGKGNGGARVRFVAVAGALPTDDAVDANLHRTRWAVRACETLRPSMLAETKGPVRPGAKSCAYDHVREVNATSRFAVRGTEDVDRWDPPFVIMHATDNMTTFSSTLSANSHFKFLTSVSAPSIQDAQGSQDNAEDLLPSDLELSFASAMELNSPIRRPVQLTGTASREDAVPMDISPEPSRFVHQPRIAGSHLLEKVTRTRAFTSSARLSERNFSNETPAPPVTSSCRGTLANHVCYF
jgi:hypothetical protein